MWTTCRQAGALLVARSAPDESAPPELIFSSARSLELGESLYVIRDTTSPRPLVESDEITPTCRLESLPEGSNDIPRRKTRTSTVFRRVGLDSPAETGQYKQLSPPESTVTTAAYRTPEYHLSDRSSATASDTSEAGPTLGALIDRDSSYSSPAAPRNAPSCLPAHASPSNPGAFIPTTVGAGLPPLLATVRQPAEGSEGGAEGGASEAAQSTPIGASASTRRWQHTRKLLLAAPEAPHRQDVAGVAEAATRRAREAAVKEKAASKAGKAGEGGRPGKKEPTSAWLQSTSPAGPGAVLFKRAPESESDDAAREKHAPEGVTHSSLRRRLQGRGAFHASTDQLHLLCRSSPSPEAEAPSSGAANSPPIPSTATLDERIGLAAPVPKVKRGSSSGSRSVTSRDPPVCKLPPPPEALDGCAVRPHASAYEALHMPAPHPALAGTCYCVAYPTTPARCATLLHRSAARLALGTANLRDEAFSNWRLV